jgi:flavin reductase (DIM6/NTAB) family NADH-FMN oxidoreductase RutF
LTTLKPAQRICDVAELASAEPADLAGESVGYADFCEIMGSFASGISVVTSVGRDAQAHGLTCSAVCSVSADPPLLLSCIRTPSSTLDALREQGSFAVNFLDSRARKVSELFASRDEDKFAAVRWRPGRVTGMPVLGCTLAHAECSVHDVIDAGDHVIVLGRLIGGQVDSARYPLGYWRGKYVVVRPDPA